METIIQKILKLVLDLYGAEYDVVMVSEESGHYTAAIETTNPPKLIGRNGSILNAIETLLKNILFKQTSERIFVSVDVDGYRAQQHEKIYKKVQKNIDFMKENNMSEIKLHPMHPATRRLVHLWVAKTFTDLTSDSVGEGRDRAVRIYYV